MTYGCGSALDNLDSGRSFSRSSYEQERLESIASFGHDERVRWDLGAVANTDFLVVEYQTALLYTATCRIQASVMARSMWLLEKYESFDYMM